MKFSAIINQSSSFYLADDGKENVRVDEVSELVVSRVSFKK